MTDTKKQKTWGELPLEIRETLSDEETVGKIEAIGQKQGLRPMEQGFLVRICANLMKGVIEPGVFVSTITDELDISREKAALIAVDINRDIFSPVKDALREVHAKKGGVQKLDPSLVTCLPAQMSKAAAIGNKAPGNAPVGNILEQKLAGSFRMKGEGVVTSTVQGLTQGGVPTPRLVVPPPPRTQMPAPPPSPSSFIPPAQGIAEPPRVDPYRDHDV